MSTNGRVASIEKQIETEKVKFSIYLDDRGIVPRIVLRCESKTFDKGFPLLLDEASILGSTLFQASRNIQARHVMRMGEVRGKM